MKSSCIHLKVLSLFICLVPSFDLNEYKMKGRTLYILPCPYTDLLALNLLKPMIDPTWTFSTEIYDPIKCYWHRVVFYKQTLGPEFEPVLDFLDTWPFLI